MLPTERRRENCQQFITDEENRRYSPWIVDSIESPIDYPIDYDHVYAEEQILKYYKVPLPDTPLEYIKFRYTSEILEKIGVNPALRQNLNSHNIGAVMSRLGFKKIHKEHGNGWAVIEKEGCEINSDAVIDPNDTMED